MPNQPPPRPPLPPPTHALSRYAKHTHKHIDAPACIQSVWCVCVCVCMCVCEWEGAGLLADKEAGAAVMAIISRASQISVERAG